jgi:aminoglycoside phosphotransferase (APT) family kinase protein
MQRSSAGVLSAICDEIARIEVAGAGTDPTALLRTIGPLLEWVLMNEAGPVAPAREISLRPAPTSEDAAPPLRAEAVTRYLQERFHDPSARVDELRHVIGGFSRRTTIVVCELCGQHQEIVLRQVVAGEPDDRLTPEYEVIRFAFSHGVLAPEPLWIEPRPNTLGGPFFATRRQRGTNVGDVFGAPDDVHRRVGEDLAAFLARLHTLDVSSLPSAPGRSMRGQDKVGEAVDACLGRLVAAVEQPVPLAQDLFAWLRRNLPAAATSGVLVHGDVGPHNVLVADGRVSAVLDWERSHFGDPAEDLAYLQPTLAGVIEWDDFMAAYVAGGGRPPDPASTRFYHVWQDVWRYVACMQLLSGFEHSGRLSSAFAGRVFGPRFLASAARSALGDEFDLRGGA